MVINLNVNIDFCFNLSCKLVGWLTILGFPMNFSGEWLFPNFKRWNFSTEKIVGEWKSASWGDAQTKDEVRECKPTKKMFLHSDFLKLCRKKNKTSLKFPGKRTLIQAPSAEREALHLEIILQT